jgi:hypothetical protein
VPISRKQFDEGLDEAGIRIQKFLAEHPDQAYEPDEVAEAMGESRSSPGGSFTRRFAFLNITWQFHCLLEDLVKKGCVKKKRIQGKEYYCISLK